MVYHIEGSKLFIHASELVDEVTNLFKIDFDFVGIYNSTFKIEFYVFNDVDFHLSRSLMKYFYQNIPCVQDIIFDNYSVILELKRSNIQSLHEYIQERLDF